MNELGCVKVHSGAVCSRTSKLHKLVGCLFFFIINKLTLNLCGYCCSGLTPSLFGFELTKAFCVFVCFAVKCCRLDTSVTCWQTCSRYLIYCHTVTVLWRFVWLVCSYCAFTAVLHAHSYKTNTCCKRTVCTVVLVDHLSGKAVYVQELTAVGEMSGILPKIRELSGKKSCRGKVA